MKPQGRTGDWGGRVGGGLQQDAHAARIGTQVKEQDASDLIGTSKLQPYHFCVDESFEVFSVFLHL
jgi:hypothetical protein